MNSEPVVMRKVTPAIIPLQMIVGLEYLAVLVVGFLNPFGASAFGRPYVEYSFGIFTLAILGMSVLSYALRNIKHRDEVWLWLLIAAGLAPLVSFLCSVVALNEPPLSAIAGAETRGFVVLNVLGFYLPFVLVGLRVRHKYRQDKD